MRSQESLSRSRRRRASMRQQARRAAVGTMQDSILWRPLAYHVAASDGRELREGDVVAAGQSRVLFPAARLLTGDEHPCPRPCKVGGDAHYFALIEDVPAGDRGVGLAAHPGPVLLERKSGGLG